MLASLHHKNLVQVYALGEHAGEVYFVMELVEGQPVSEVLRATLERFCDAGFSKFVVVPLEDAPSWADELAEVGDAVLPLQAGLAAPR